MSNLQSALKAIKNKGPKKHFQVRFKQIETYTVNLEAIDKESASEEANEIYNNGGAEEDGNCSTSEISCEEI